MNENVATMVNGEHHWGAKYFPTSVVTRFVNKYPVALVFYFFKKILRLRNVIVLHWIANFIVINKKLSGYLSVPIRSMKWNENLKFISLYDDYTHLYELIHKKKTIKIKQLTLQNIITQSKTIKKLNLNK